MPQDKHVMDRLRDHERWDRTHHAASFCVRASANGFSPRLRLHESQIQLRLRSAESNGERQRRHGRRIVGAATARGFE
ncbi:MAG TPA: hypothetical protein VKI44_03785 [Acetobacteraceae bacterium]|nr:hypothetical protein [Acetobacteraceae bacterium]